MVFDRYATSAHSVYNTRRYFTLNRRVYFLLVYVGRVSVHIYTMYTYNMMRVHEMRYSCRAPGVITAHVSSIPTCFPYYYHYNNNNNNNIIIIHHPGGIVPTNPLFLISEISSDISHTRCAHHGRPRLAYSHYKYRADTRSCYRHTRI